MEGDLCDGDPQSAPVLFLHGWTLDRRMWGPQLAHSPSRRALIAIDRRGFGRSTAPPDLRREAEDAAAILDYLGAEKAVIVGMSQSGRVAADFALRFPERLAGLVLQGARLGVSATGSPEEEIPIARYAQLAGDGRVDKMKELWRTHPLMLCVKPEAQALVDRMLEDYEGRDLHFAANAAPDFSASEIARICVPALVVTGAEDTRQRRKIADDLARIMPNATRAEIAEGGHLCNLCAPAAYNHAVFDFLNRLDQ